MRRGLLELGETNRATPEESVVATCSAMAAPRQRR